MKNILEVNQLETDGHHLYNRKEWSIRVTKSYLCYIDDQLHSSIEEFSNSLNKTWPTMKVLKFKLN